MIFNEMQMFILLYTISGVASTFFFFSSLTGFYSFLSTPLELSKSHRMWAWQFLKKSKKKFSKSREKVREREVGEGETKTEREREGGIQIKMRKEW